MQVGYVLSILSNYATWVKNKIIQGRRRRNASRYHYCCFGFFLKSCQKRTKDFVQELVQGLGLYEQFYCGICIFVFYIDHRDVKTEEEERCILMD